MAAISMTRPFSTSKSNANQGPSGVETHHFFIPMESATVTAPEFLIASVAAVIESELSGINNPNPDGELSDTINDAYLAIINEDDPEQRQRLANQFIGGAPLKGWDANSIWGYVSEAAKIGSSIESFLPDASTIQDISILPQYRDKEVVLTSCTVYIDGKGKVSKIRPHTSFENELFSAKMLSSLGMSWVLPNAKFVSKRKSLNEGSDSSYKMNFAKVGAALGVLLLVGLYILKSSSPKSQMPIDDGNDYIAKTPVPTYSTRVPMTEISSTPVDSVRLTLTPEPPTIPPTPEQIPLDSRFMKIVDFEAYLAANSSVVDRNTGLFIYGRQAFLVKGNIICPYTFSVEEIRQRIADGWVLYFDAKNITNISEPDPVSMQLLKLLEQGYTIDYPTPIIDTTGAPRSLRGYFSDWTNHLNAIPFDKQIIAIFSYNKSTKTYGFGGDQTYYYDGTDVKKMIEELSKIYPLETLMFQVYANDNSQLAAFANAVGWKPISDLFGSGN